jgi:hypothetical protein
MGGKGDQVLTIEAGLVQDSGKDIRIVYPLTSNVARFEYSPDHSFVELIGGLARASGYPEGQQRSAAVGQGLFPQIPLGAFQRVRLLQGKELPSNGEFACISSLYLCEPYAGSKGEGAYKVEVDIYVHRAWREVGVKRLYLN